MSPRTTTRRHRSALLGVTSLALVAAGLAGGQAEATTTPGAGATVAAPASAAAPGAKAASSGEAAGNYDSRAVSSPALVRRTAEVQKSRGAAAGKLADQIGGDATVSLDPVTGTPRDVTSRLGFLTGPSNRAATDVALDYVRGNLSGFGLTSADLTTLREVRSFTDINDITHVYWTQEIDGIPVFGNGLRAAIDGSGRLITVQGAPVSGVGREVRRSTEPSVSRADALDAAVADVRRDAARAGSTAERVWFMTADGLRPGWVTYTQPSGTEAYQHVIDASSGRTLYRRSTVNFEKDPAAASTSEKRGGKKGKKGKKKLPKGSALVHENYPGASGNNTGGRQHVVNLHELGYLPRRATWMRGPYASVWADLNDDDRVQEREKSKVPPRRKKAKFRLKPFPTAAGQATCSQRYVCTWDPTTPGSWRKNKNQDGVQGLYFTSKFAEWLKAAPFGFTADLGNFERAGGDEVYVNTMDGADTADGLPDGGHVNNANFNTPPDGFSPTMQMYLNVGPAYLAASSTEAFDNIGHEYTHGLSNRLVVDSMGFSTLNSYQAGGMGEGWSDLYSFDYLEKNNLISNDRRVDGELLYDRYLTKNRPFTRTAAIDCKVGDSLAPLCRQLDGEGTGGYTFGDIPGQLTTEVHNAGEVWAQTLWDIREVLGHARTMRLVTAAMTLSPDNPSMLDMRDAIITADKVIFSSANTDRLWKKFAARGFGYFAASIDGSDAEPVEDFSMPPSGTEAPGAILGTVTDTNGDPVAGALVLVAGHSSSTAGSYSDVTGADGTYVIGGVFPGTYPKVVAIADGFGNGVESATVPEGDAAVVDFALRRDWAAASGGASIASFDGVDYSIYGCGPDELIDLSLGTGWGSTTGPTEDPVTAADQVEPKSIVIALPQAVDITTIAVDPGNTCGDPGSSSTADYVLEVGATAEGPWTEAASGTFTEGDRGTLVDIPVTVPPAMSFVRYTMVSPQVPDFAGCPDAFGGCTYMDSSELAVYDD
ncbi:M36 family metallopeptidase [Nocardioides sp.]|uniref:M36 family metallopeptidase n=1 Tax=Nocardioides sp. TaxID=35761 RepID=UPI00321A7B36